MLFLYFWGRWTVDDNFRISRENRDTKDVIRDPNSKKRKCNGEKNSKKEKQTNNDSQGGKWKNKP